MSTKIKPKKFRVTEGESIKLKAWPTRVKPFYASKGEYQERLQDQISQLIDLQDVLYANRTYAVLFLFQAMDAAGKDGMIKHVMSGINPQGCRVAAFKQPGSEDLAHDFLWRSVKQLPERGQIGIFNRSYYEEVLVVRVHPQWLARQNLPEELQDESGLWKGRYRSIVDFEKHLHRNGTQVVKFFLHLSKEEQRERFLSRIDEPKKNWKFSAADAQERGFWKQYMRAYENCLEATSTEEAPWYIVPADDKDNARLIVSEIILETLRVLPLRYPQLSKEQERELQRLRKLVAKD